MVHALEQIHRLLWSSGCLMDIHPALTATLIEVHHSGAVTFSAPVPDEPFEYTQYAEDALAQSIKDGLFAMRQMIEFEGRTYASSVAELRDYIAQESAYEEEPPVDFVALQEGEFAGRVQGALQAAGEGSEVARLNTARITRLDPVRR